MFFGDSEIFERTWWNNLVSIFLSGKLKRIKQAREEAEAEIETFRRCRDQDYLEYEKRYLGTKEDVAAQIQRDTDAYLVALENIVKKNKDKVHALFHRLSTI